jgi:hypothetical protein
LAAAADRFQVEAVKDEWMVPAIKFRSPRLESANRKSGETPLVLSNAAMALFILSSLKIH